VVTNNAKQKTSLSKLTGSKDPINEKKLQVMEEDMTELRKKLIEKDRDVERLEAELSLSKTKGSKGSVHKK
jgi:predicted RNase H-like nuclease (RuvC/YqgF family)